MKSPGQSSACRTSLYEQIADRLEDRILAGDFAEEGKLPSEQTLTDQCGVSRTVIREALKLLKERGLVDSRNGMGSYITKPVPGNLADVIGRMVIMDGIDYDAITEVRMILENAACRLAAQRAGEDDMKEMARILARLDDRTISVDERRELDYAFHAAIARSSGNHLLEILVQTMKSVFLTMIEKGIFNEGGIDDAIFRHRRIYSALERKDPDEAEAAMKDHIEVSRTQVERYLRDNPGAEQGQPRHEN